MREKNRDERSRHSGSRSPSDSRRAGDSNRSGESSRSGPQRAVDARPGVAVRLVGLVERLEEEIESRDGRGAARGPLGPEKTEAKVKARRERRIEGPGRVVGKADFTPKEKEDYVEEVEEYEGPDRREPHGPSRELPKEPGVARS